MTEAILAAGGTLIAYMVNTGSWRCSGLPSSSPTTPTGRSTAAREMLGPRLERFNGWMIAQGYPSGFRMGVGLHSGLVMAGNVGSEERLDYTAICDTTNTASRLEGMTKGQPYMLFMSSATQERLTRPPDDLVSLGEFEVRGRAEDRRAADQGRCSGSGAGSGRTRGIGRTAGRANRADARHPYLTNTL